MVLYKFDFFKTLDEFKNIIIKNNHITPTKKKIGASLKFFIETIFLVIGIRPIEIKKIPERYAIILFFIIYSEIFDVSFESD